MNRSLRRPSFQDLFGATPTVRASAPGRVNLMGEHTDYNGGYVLPMAIPQQTVVELRPRGDDTAEVWSANTVPERAQYVVRTETPRGTWLDYVQGVTNLLGSSGHLIAGFSLRIESSVPVGSGLSSSAALEISLLRALREAFGLRLSDLELARFGQRAEQEFVGAPIGIMDQMACTFADEYHALFLDTRTLDFARIEVPAQAQLIVINSGVPHNHAAGDYRTRRAECEQAAALLGVDELRDLRPDDLGRIDRLPDPLGRRVRHVVTENGRVLDTVDALRASDLQATGALFRASHASMRDDFEISLAEIDSLVAAAAADPAIYGARLTGGGFGGSIVALAAGTGAMARGAAERLSQRYGVATGRTATVLVPQPYDDAD